MLEKKLEQAREKSAKKRKQLVIGGAIVLVCCLFLVVGLSFFISPSSDKAKKKELVQDSADQISVEGQEELRSQFKELLLQYENRIESRLDELHDWQKERIFILSEEKKSAVTSFGNGEYQKAIEGLKNLESAALLLLEVAETAFVRAMESSRSYLKDDNYQQAKVHLEQAVLIKPSDPEVLTLRQNIEKLPAILPFLQQAEVARAENNLQKEYDVLQQAQLLAPERQDIQKRLQQLKDLLRQHSFDNHIAQGFIKVESGLATEARFYYQQAKMIDPARVELGVLLGKIKELEKNIRVRLGLKKAEQALRRDDWQSAYDAFARVVKDEPQNNEVREGLRKSQYILGLQKEVHGYLRDPYRLANSKVGGEVKQLLTRLAPATQMSYSLQRQAKELEEKLALLNRALAVQVLSDGKTNVTVRGVGKVGQVTEKTIHLKPGNYVFEGVRRGYTSKLVRVLVPYGVQNFQLQVICDEPI